MIQFEIKEDYACILLDRPEKAHAYHRQMLIELEEYVHTVTLQQKVCVIGSTGTKHFCAGADLNQLKKKSAEDALNLRSQRVFNRIAESSSIFIAALQGAAIAGGFELALACDLRVAHPHAFAALPETEHGLIPSAGGCTRLTQLLGGSIARGVILGGERIGAERGYQWGLFHRLNEAPLDEAIRWASQLSRSSRLALHLAKQTLNNPTLEKERLAEAILYERRLGR